MIKLHYILDTYAWIEYFIGSKKGAIVKTLIDAKKNTFSTLENCIAELKLWCLAENENFQKLFSIVKINSSIEPITLNNWIEAANIRHEKRKQMKDFGLMDALILAKQDEIKGKIVTGDKHFKNMKNVEFI